MDNEISIFFSKWKCSQSGPFFKSDLSANTYLKDVPRDCSEIIQTYGGREGFLSDTYLRLFRWEELWALNEAFEINENAPELVIFGSNGYGDAFCFSRNSPQILQVPFIPLALEHAEVVGRTFASFFQSLKTDCDYAESSPLMGMEMHLIQPLVFGGHPTENKNRVLVPVEKYPEITSFWNAVYRRHAKGG
jgi:hypothetical protein